MWQFLVLYYLLKLKNDILGSGDHCCVEAEAGLWFNGWKEEMSGRVF